MAEQDESKEIEASKQEVKEETPEVKATEGEKTLDEQIEAMQSEADADLNKDKKPEGGEGDEDPPPAAAEFTPNFKFKVLEEEHEIDELFRPLMKDKESEAKVREIYEKALGIDHVKSDRDRFRDDSNNFKGALEKQTSAINTLSSYLDTKDYPSFFQALGIPMADIMKIALQEAQKKDWTAEQRQTYEENLNTKRRANVYQEQYNTNQSELEGLRQDQVVKDYRLELYKPEVRAFQEAFDQRNGKDAFRNEVADLGTFNEKLHNKVLPIDELVGSIMKKFGAFMQTNAPAGTPPANTQIVPPNEVPVIPNTGPAGQAPAQQAIKSLADLQKIADAL